MDIKEMNEKCLLELDPRQKTAILRLTSPPANVLSSAVLCELRQCLDKLDEYSIYALVISGNEEYFSAGANIREIAGNSTEANAEYFSQIYEVFKRIENMKCPVIAAVNGFAMGAGFELALCADIRVADEKAVFAATGVNLGLVFCTQRLPRLIGYGPSKELLLTAKKITALEAEHLGIAAYVSPAGKAVPQAQHLAAIISQKSITALQAVKQAMNEGIGKSLAESMEMESRYLNKMFAGKELAERARAFLRKEE
jgi:enoyl-CoA hydratase